MNCTAEWAAANHVLATCRTALKQQGVLGLNMAPCMRAFLERLPMMLQEQYAYEKVSNYAHSDIYRCLVLWNLNYSLNLSLKSMRSEENTWSYLGRIK